MSKITSVSIGELCRLDSLRKKYKLPTVPKELYLIPDYQRGYRWDADIHVEALLSDLLDFKNNRKGQEKYCLQPIVITASQNHPTGWEVIDGQQRLTTIYLLLNALGDEAFDLEFEAREASNKFIKDLIEKNILKDTEPDFYYMSQAWKKINSWVQEREKEGYGFKRTFLTTIFDYVNVIWYDVESTRREINIDIFNRLNIGKIPLTDAELVKALLLTKIKPLYPDPLELTMRQSEINDYWHHIEHELRKPQKWGFLTGNVQKEYANHIDLIFDLMANNVVSNDQNEKYTTFLWFENQIKEAAENIDAFEENINDENGESIEMRSLLQGRKALELWDEIKSAFARVNSWFGDNSITSKPTIYHYIGYLLASHRLPITTIYSESINKSKNQFILYLYDKAKDTIKDLKIEELEYGKNNSDIERVLLLFNVLTCQNISDGLYNRFPFDRFNETKKDSGWSLEHIFAQNSKDPIKEKKRAIRWLADTKKTIEKIPNFTVESKNEEGAEKIQINVTDLIQEISAMIDSGEREIDLDSFNELRDRINNSFGDSKMHNISNLALLSRKDNSMLNNSIFPVKRDKIIELEKSGSYLPECTLNVFLKFYSSADSQPYYWSGQDAKEYMEQILNSVKSFIYNHGKQYTR